MAFRSSGVVQALRPEPKPLNDSLCLAWLAEGAVCGGDDAQQGPRKLWVSCPGP